MYSQDDVYNPAYPGNGTTGVEYSNCNAEGLGLLLPDGDDPGEVDNGYGLVTMDSLNCPSQSNHGVLGNTTDKYGDYAYAGDELAASDYKSDSKVNENKHDDQLLIYSYLLSRQNPSIKVDYISPFFIKHSSNIKPKKVSKERMEKSVKWLINLKNQIESLGTDEKNFPANPCNLCGWCSHHMTGHCQEGNDYMNKNNNVIEMGDNDEILVKISEENSTPK